MEILFLGTGAADWGKKENSSLFFRRNSAALIDGCMLIDPGPGVIDAIKEFNVDIKNVKYILNTHKHEDHFNEETIEYLVNNGAEFIEITEPQEVQLGKYSVKAVKGHHSIETFHFLVSDSNSCLFYGTDGAWLLYDEVLAIKEKKVDLAVLDGTIGFIEGDYRIFEHNNLNMVLEIKKTLSPYIKRFCITHMAHTLHSDHKTLSDNMERFGVEVAFDGMKIKF